MKIKKYLITCSLFILITTSSIPVFAKASNNTIMSNFSPQTIDNFSNKTITRKQTTKNNNQIKSVSENSYNETKAVADQKASALLNCGDTSVQYALIDNGKIVLSGNAGVYSKDSNKALTADTMYGIGSTSKMFLTTAVMKLVDEGKVNLDAPVTKYIKEFTMADSRYKKITVRMLLNHSSGLMGSTTLNASLFGDNDTYNHDNFLKELKTQRLKANPGAYSVYCNDGFTLAEILVEHVTGTTFTNYIKDNITNSLKMNNTKTPASEFDRNNLAKTYCNGVSTSLPTENINNIAAGGIYSTAEDLCTFATTFTKNSNGILSNKSLKAMENKEYLRGLWPKDADSNLNYGLGWDSVNLYPFNQYNIKALSKGGDTPFYHSNLIVLPEKNMAMAVVTSGGHSGEDELAAQEVLLSALKEKGEINKIIPDKTFSEPQKAAVPQEIKNYEGMYLSGSEIFNIKIDESGTLTLSDPQRPQYGSQTAVYTKDGNFVSTDGSMTLSFVKESNGKIYAKQTGYETMPALGQGAVNLYFAQKIDDNNLPKNVSDTWNKRTGKKYYLLNEKYSSIDYLLSSQYLKVDFIKGLEGYFEVDKITGKNSASSILDGPGMLSRDQSDFTFYKKNNFEYLTGDGYIYEEEASINTLPTDNEFNCTIDKNGYGKWYKIDNSEANKEITVDIPNNAAFIVYDSNENLVNDSLITGITTVKLPQNGKIVFLGSPKATFTVKYN
ncbi:beta-lactamase family protein [Clostridium felsineum]|uniref:serine hydrolase domain-containing protein n=1 Tax=Clostridium felsineum TaxID=36839 RepID=UPI00214DBD8D|nr:serine hydrolase domain-containing protein [Clostridium felsineum]MCR3758521.1 beta-lactamase family protein [Clostridium felsineum]